MEELNLKDYITNAIKYWEIRRLAYNAVLLVITLKFVIPAVDAPVNINWMHKSLELLVLAVIANLFYCTAYPIDIFVQASDFRETWLRQRWILFYSGLLLASVLAWVSCMAMFIWGTGL